MFLHLPSFIIMEFITTKRCARAIVYEGHKYVLNRRGRDGRIFWRCGRNQSCSGSLCTLEDEIISQKDTHNHPPDDAEIQAEKIVNSIRAKARDTIQPIPAVYKSKQLLLDLTRKRLQQSFQLLLISSPGGAVERNSPHWPKLPNTDHVMHGQLCITLAMHHRMEDEAT